MTRNAINWFEIPSVQFERAVKFYESILNITMKRLDFGGVPHAIFPSEENGVGGAIVKSDNNIPSNTGTFLFLNCNGMLEEVVGRIENNGGKVILPIVDIGEQGSMAYIIDIEGNKIGLHSYK